jgi:hypothetical protein
VSGSLGSKERHRDGRPLDGPVCGPTLRRARDRARANKPTTIPMFRGSARGNGWGLAPSHPQSITARPAWAACYKHCPREQCLSAGPPRVGGMAHQILPEW